MVNRVLPISQKRLSKKHSDSDLLQKSLVSFLVALTLSATTTVIV